MAVGLLEESLQSVPNDASVHYHLAVAYDKKNEHGKARQHFLKALELNPKFPEADLARKALMPSS